MRVGFIVPGVVPMLRQQQGTVYGGSELRAWRIARGLAGLGFAVVLTSFDHEEPPAEVLGPVTIVSERKLAKSWRSLVRRSGAQRVSLGWEQAKADVYVTIGVADYSAALAEWCQANGHPLVLMAGSDADFAAEYRPANTDRNAYGSRCDHCYDAIMRATEIVVQSETQRRLARDRFGRNARIIANPVDVLSSPSAPNPGKRYVLWVGKSDSVKQPGIAVTVAQLCPEIPFRMIVNRVDGVLFDRIAAEAPANVSIIECVRPQDMGQQYAGALALLNTSRFEGFPNAVLEAGRFGVPLLSLSVDPGEIIAREGGGANAGGDVEALAAFVRRYHAEPEVASAAGRRLQDYVRRNHEASARIAEFADLILRLARNKEQHARGIA